MYELKHYVTFYMPGAFFPEESGAEVASRIPAELANIPKYTYALEFWDREQIIVDEEVLKGEAKNISNRILFGKTYNKAELKREGFDEDSILYSNVFNNGYKAAVKCITGNWQPAQKSDIVLESYNAIRELTKPI